MLNERRQMTFYKTSRDFRIIDIELELRPGKPSAVKLGKTPFGFLATRAAQSMTPFDGGGEIINALGQRNEQQAHWQHAPWIDQSGPILPGKWGGIALFDHQDNPGYPTAWHCRNDGWAGASFNLDKSWIIEPESSLNLRYRVVLHSYDAKGAEISHRYSEYACESEVRLRKAQHYSGV